MSYAHTSVNSISKVYLQNERRYNYTTPKSYLEQISLYGKLLTQKFSDLHKKVSRLENGLDKLRSTAAQVDALKAKLAIQEIELKEKNEAADRLIEIVGIETQKVQNEKAFADEEEKKVGFIAEEVAKKQRDCEEDLVKAEPALAAAQEALVNSICYVIENILQIYLAEHIEQSQLDGTEIIRQSSWCCHQRHGCCHGSVSA